MKPSQDENRLFSDGGSDIFKRNPFNDAKSDWSFNTNNFAPPKFPNTAFSFNPAFFPPPPPPPPQFQSDSLLKVTELIVPEPQQTKEDNIPISIKEAYPELFMEPLKSELRKIRIQQEDDSSSNEVSSISKIQSTIRQDGQSDLQLPKPECLQDAI